MRLLTLLCSESFLLCWLQSCRPLSWGSSFAAKCACTELLFQIVVRGIFFWTLHVTHVFILFNHLVTGHHTTNGCTRGWVWARCPIVSHHDSSKQSSVPSLQGRLFVVPWLYHAPEMERSNAGRLKNFTVGLVPVGPTTVQ